MCAAVMETLSCVSFAPLQSRPFYSPEDAGNSPNMILVEHFGPSISYVIPTFDVLSVSIRPMVVKARVGSEEENFDMFVRADPSLDAAMLPNMMIVKDHILIRVRNQMRFLFA